MAKHDWLKDAAGNIVEVGEYPGFPYCIYIQCLRCDEIFCDNNCDGDVFGAECPNGQLELFPLEEIL
jgi:hypothetical protein